MKTIVSNSSPIRYLTYIGEQELLRRLFTKILIPTAVFQELSHKNTPKIVRNFIQASPSWIDVYDVEEISDTSLDYLDIGEKAAILLAERTNAALLLIDEKKGRLTAMDRGLNVVGTLGILELADVRYNIELPTIIKKLLQTNFNVSPSLINDVLERHYRRI